EMRRGGRRWRYEASDPDGHGRRHGPVAVERGDRAQEGVIRRRRPRRREVESSLDAPLEDAGGQVLVNRIALGETVEGSVELDRVVLDHAVHRPPDADAERRDGVEREDV